MSDYFVAQLKHLQTEGQIHTKSIVDELHYLEGIKSRTRTKKATAFKRGKLKGFWHSHFFNGDTSQQAVNYLKLLDRDGGTAFKDIIKNIVNETDDPVTISKKIAERVVAQQYQDITNKKSWTGDWIVYAKHGKVNYYLMLCRHSNPGDDGDPIYVEMKEKCGEQFPFIFENK